MKTDSGGLGDLQSVFDGLYGSTFFTIIDLASGFFQIDIAEEDKEKIAFRDANGSLLEYNRCGIGLKILPEASANYVAQPPGPLKGRGVENWLDDIIISAKTFNEHLTLVDQTLEQFPDKDY